MRQWLERLTAVVLAGLLLASPLTAQNLTDDLVSQLREQGFHKVTITRTLLGRVLILGSSEEGQREVVLNPQTGEILRDYFRPREQLVALPSNSGGKLTYAPSPGEQADSDKGDEKGGRGGGGGKSGGKGSDGTGTADGDSSSGDDGGGRGSEPGGKTPQTGG